jgi:single-strand DNA-binding protein
MLTMTIAGNCGKDAELRRTQSGDSVLGFSIAVDNGKDKDGNKRDSTWVKCSIWGKRADSLADYIKKGSKLVVTGRPGVDVYEGKGQLTLSVQDITFMGGNQREERREEHGASNVRGPIISIAAGNPMEEDIPFAPEWRG